MEKSSLPSPRYIRQSMGITRTAFTRTKRTMGEELPKITDDLSMQFFGYFRTGAPWRDLPPDYGKWGTVHQRFRRWRGQGDMGKIA